MWKRLLHFVCLNVEEEVHRGYSSITPSDYFDVEEETSSRGVQGIFFGHPIVVRRTLAKLQLPAMYGLPMGPCSPHEAEQGAPRKGKLTGMRCKRNVIQVCFSDFRQNYLLL